MIRAATKRIRTREHKTESHAFQRVFLCVLGARSAGKQWTRLAWLLRNMQGRAPEISHLRGFRALLIRLLTLMIIIRLRSALEKEEVEVSCGVCWPCGDSPECDRDWGLPCPYGHHADNCMACTIGLNTIHSMCQGMQKKTSHTICTQRPEALLALLTGCTMAWCAPVLIAIFVWSMCHCVLV